MADSARKRARQKRYYLRNRQRVGADHRNRTFKAHSGIAVTSDWFAAQFLAQGGVCAICGQPEVSQHKSGNLKALSIDHDGLRLRSLLCARCNLGIGLLGNDPDRLRAAAIYIDRHREAAV